MDAHEAIYLSHLNMTIDEEVWLGWQRVMQLDAATPEFQAIWPAARNSYSPRFGEYVDGVLAQERRAMITPRLRPTEPPSSRP